MKRLLIVAAVVGLIVVAVKKGSQRREEWHGLTEAEAREKVAQRLPGRMPEERREAVTDKIVGTMRDKGVLTDDDAVDLGAAEADVDLTDDEAAEEPATSTV